MQFFSFQPLCRLFYYFELESYLYAGESIFGHTMKVFKVDPYWNFNFKSSKQSGIMVK